MLKTRADLEREFGDYLRGLLMESFAQSRKTGTTDHSAAGAMMYSQLIRAKELLDRIHAWYVSPPPEKVPDSIKAPAKVPVTTNGKH